MLDADMERGREAASAAAAAAGERGEEELDLVLDEECEVPEIAWDRAPPPAGTAP